MSKVLLTIALLSVALSPSAVTVSVEDTYAYGQEFAVPVSVYSPVYPVDAIILGASFANADCVSVSVENFPADWVYGYECSRGYVSFVAYSFASPQTGLPHDARILIVFEAGQNFSGTTITLLNTSVASRGYSLPVELVNGRVIVGSRLFLPAVY